MKAMDASSRAELAALRVRAYGPGADIVRDPVALARLDELEELVRHEHDLLTTSDLPPHMSAFGADDGGRDMLADPDRDPVLDAVAPAPAPDEPVTPPTAAQSARRRLTVLGLGLVAVLIAAAVTVPRLLPAAEPAATVASGQEQQQTDTFDAYTLARDDRAIVLFQVPLDEYFREQAGVPGDETVPDFAASGPIRWTEPLGEYYGWDLWLAGAEGALQDEHCIALLRGDVVRTRCVPATLRPQSALVATLPYAVISADERPPGMTPAQRIGFWWQGDHEVSVLLAQVPVR